MPDLSVFEVESMRFDPLVEHPKHRRRGLSDTPRHPSDRLVSPVISHRILPDRHRHSSETVRDPRRDVDIVVADTFLSAHMP